MPTNSTNAANPEADTQPPWFIFTDSGHGFCVPGDTITAAVAAWRRARHVTAGEIVGVIRGAAEGGQIGRIVQTPCFGVIVCVQNAITGNSSSAGGVGPTRGQIDPNRACNGRARRRAVKSTGSDALR